MRPTPAILPASLALLVRPAQLARARALSVRLARRVQPVRLVRVSVSKVRKAPWVALARLGLLARLALVRRDRAALWGLQALPVDQLARPAQRDQLALRVQPVRLGQRALSALPEAPQRSSFRRLPTPTFLVRSGTILACSLSPLVKEC